MSESIAQLCPLKRRRNLPSALFVSALLTSALSFLTLPVFAVDSAEPNAKHSKSEEFFAGPIPQFEIEIAPAEVTKLRQRPREYAMATVREGGDVYTNVAVHLKGARGSFRPFDDRPALTLNFDKFAPGQHFHKMGKLHLNNSVQDPSYMEEGICGTLFRAAGVPASRAVPARVKVNRRDLGLYVALEGYDKGFLKRHYQDATGNFYDGGFLTDIDQPIEKTGGANPNDRRDLQALVSAAREPNLSKRYQRLDKLLDMTNFISFLATDILVWDWDGYYLHANNYRVYHDPGNDKIYFLPHGMDQMYWEPNGSLIPSPHAILARAILETPEGKAAYLARMGDLITNVYNSTNIVKEIDNVERRIAVVLPGLDPSVAAQHRQAVATLRNAVVTRGKSALRQMAAPPKPIQFNNGASVQITGWEPHAGTGDNSNQQTVILDEATASDGAKALAIGARNGVACTASWRQTITLDPGHYRFSAMARCEKVNPTSDTSGTGAGIRISGARARTNSMSGTSPWKKLDYDFDVASGSQTVVLICELRATQGKVFFNEDSLKITRLAPPR